MEDRKGQAISASSLNVLAGIWLIIAPFILGYVTSTPRGNDIVLGIIIGVLALIRAFTPIRSTWLSWVNVVLGIWLIIAPFVLGYLTTTPRWNDIILGIIVIVLSTWSGSSVSRTLGRTAFR